MKSDDELTTGSGRLHESLKTLMLRWEGTKDVWNDVKRREFEADYLSPLEPHLVTTVEKINRLAQVFAAARRECS